MPGATTFEGLAQDPAGTYLLSFTVADLDATAALVIAAGYQPLGSADDTGWREAFLHRDQAGGIGIRLGRPQSGPAAAAWRPAPLPDAAAELVCVAYAVADLDHALALFKGLLGGRTVDAGAGGGVGFVDLGWPDTAARTDATIPTLRLLAGPPLAPWLDGHPGRLHSLCLRLADPAAVAGAVARPGWWEVAPTPPGLRLVLIGPTGAVPVVV